MSETTGTSPTHRAPPEISIHEATPAPIIYFEATGTYSNINGIVGLLLVAGTTLPTKDERTMSRIVAVAHLRCNEVAAKNLRDVLDKALLLGTKIEGQAN